MASVQAILADHGIERILSKEAGRTSRGSVENMRKYVTFLNGLPNAIDGKELEEFWVNRVRAFFAGKPFRFRVDASLSLRAAVRDLLAQARDRQAENPGQRFEGAMMQHLVGAKLDLVLGAGVVSHHPTSEADQAAGRAGDFTPGDVAIHVTTHPTEALMARCAENLGEGLRPLVVTTPRSAAGVDSLAEAIGIADRIDIIDIEQFLATNLLERAAFKLDQHRPRVAELIARYNQLIDIHEHDPSLRIEPVG
jgi:hypothetical protein